MVTKYIKRSIAVLAFIAVISANAQQIYKNNFSNWEKLNKNIKTFLKQETLVAKNDSGKSNGVTCKLKNIKVSANTVISFEWKCKSEEPVFYAAFSFKADYSKEAFFIWDNGSNAFSKFDQENWHKVQLPATDLKTLKKEKLAAGTVLESLKFWQVGEGKQEFQIKNFQITNESIQKVEEIQASRGIYIWPRGKVVYLPTNLKQFVFIEFPSVKNPEKLKIKMNLPEGMRVVSYATSLSWAVLPANHIVPEKTVQNEKEVELNISAEDARRKFPEPFWIAFVMDVKTSPGKHLIEIDMSDKGKSLFSKTFETKVYPSLKDIKLKKLLTVISSYNGLNKESVPVYVDMLKATGINMIDLVHGEGSCNEKSVTDYALTKDMKIRLCFFIHNAIKYAKKNHVLNDKNFSYNLTWLLEHPKAFKKVLLKYIETATNGKKYFALLHDAESTAFIRNQIYGDLSPYGIESFRKFAKINSDIKLTPDVIKGKYLDEWVWFRCYQSNKITEILRELIDENWPERQLHVYSGYEFNEAPFKDRTRKRYGVDWKSMADAGLDYAGAGYGGSMAQLRATRDALKGKAAFIPGEMRIVNFKSKLRVNITPEEWSMRLISSFLNSGMKGGLHIWYGCTLEGGALIAMNKAFDFMQKIESFALKGKRIDEAVKVYPVSEKENVCILRKGGNSLLIAINPENTTKKLRIRLVDFTMKGYTSDLEIIDVDSGKKIAAKKVISLEIPAYSYRLLNILDDGN